MQIESPGLFLKMEEEEVLVDTPRLYLYVYAPEGRVEFAELAYGDKYYVYDGRWWLYSEDENVVPAEEEEVLKILRKVAKELPPSEILNTLIHGSKKAGVAV